VFGFHHTGVFPIFVTRCSYRGTRRLIIGLVTPVGIGRVRTFVAKVAGRVKVHFKTDHVRRALRSAAVATAAVIANAAPASALIVELNDVAPDRIERQRAASQGQIPLPNTPNLAQLSERLEAKGLKAGAPLFIRIFKAESELEVWMQKDGRYVLFDTYPICHWSGTLGPKLNEGDKQSPEGIYTLTSQQLHWIGRHPRSLNLGFPNVLDRAFSRTGSYILVHGGCSSVGCFAMTNPVIEEIFGLAHQALKSGQDHIQVHALPFRMTEARVKAQALSEWYDFWRNLKDAYDSFERTRVPPTVSVCEGRYHIEDALRPGEVASHDPLALCGVTAADKPDLLTSATPSSPAMTLAPWNLPARGLMNRPQPPTLALATPRRSVPRLPNPSPGQVASPMPTSARDATGPAAPLGAALATTMTSSARPGGTDPRSARRPTGSPTTASVPISCEINRPSCRKWVALQRRIIAEQRGGRATRLAERR
jgi:murein L,D-transpeptidase YafK